MAKKRMFSLDIVDSDIFLDMPQSTQNLYFHLGMRADDDGFVSSPKKIIKIIGANIDDLKLLLAKNYIQTFDDGIIVITHWKINNYIQKDRYKGTMYQSHLKELSIDENGLYTKCIQDVNKMDTQIRLDKNSIDKKRIVEAIEEKTSNEEINLSATTAKKIINIEDIIKQFKKSRNPSVYEIEELNNLSNTFSIENVLEAVKIAQKQGVLNIRYIEGVLKTPDKNQKSEEELLEKEAKKKENEELINSTKKILEEEALKKATLNLKYTDTSLIPENVLKNLTKNKSEDEENEM